MSFYLMHRGWMDSAIFKDQPYGERDAWCYLIEHAGYMPSKMRNNFKMISVERGQIPTSYRKLSEKFKWSVNRVRRFFDLLENDGMIYRNSDTGFLVITICNYDEYQNALKITDTHSDTELNTPSDTGSDTNSDTNIKKVKERKEKNNNTSREELPAWLPLAEWEGFREMRTKIKKPMTQRAERLALSKLDKFRAKGHDPTEILNQSILNNYQDLYEPKENSHAAAFRSHHQIAKPDKPTWQSEGQRLAEKYRQNAEREEQSAIIGDAEPNLCIAETIRQDTG